MDLIHSGTGTFITFNDLANSINDIYLNPRDFVLFQNYPNPFNSQTDIEFKINKTGIVQILIYNILGEEVEYFGNKEYLPGNHKILWDGKDNSGADLPSGAYLIRANISGSLRTVKSLLLK